MKKIAKIAPRTAAMMPMIQPAVATPWPDL